MFPTKMLLKGIMSKPHAPSGWMENITVSVSSGRTRDVHSEPLLGELDQVFLCTLICSSFLLSTKAPPVPATEKHPHGDRNVQVMSFAEICPGLFDGVLQRFLAFW